MVVFANSKGEFSSLPAGAKQMIREGGRGIPIVAVTDVSGERGIAAVSYAQLYDDARGAAREVRKKLEDVDVIGSAASEEETLAETEAPVSPLAESQDWTNSDGKTIKAAIDRLDGDSVVFVMDDGREVPYRISRLAPESQERIRALAKAD